jgi:hypothetical protein
MPSTITHEDYAASPDLNTDTGLLFDWDGHGYPIAYYPANAYSTWTDGPDQTAVCTIDRLADGTPMIREHSGDVLCGGCATAWLRDNDDAVCTVAYQINGEIGDAETVTCDDCGGTIYDPTA